MALRLVCFAACFASVAFANRVHMAQSESVSDTVQEAVADSLEEGIINDCRTTAAARGIGGIKKADYTRFMTKASCLKADHTLRRLTESKLGCNWVLHCKGQRNLGEFKSKSEAKKVCYAHKTHSIGDCKNDILDPTWEGLKDIIPPEELQEAMDDFNEEAELSNPFGTAATLSKPFDTAPTLSKPLDTAPTLSKPFDTAPTAVSKPFGFAPTLSKDWD
mmetsp:Transcript_65836/g.157336  ORF Transcript_65836/g.157336 Transcript_65836/m.157336 type:complete len:219 (-) Transcript_65836:93-749(-)